MTEAVESVLWPRKVNTNVEPPHHCYDYWNHLEAFAASGVCEAGEGVQSPLLFFC